MSGSQITVIVLTLNEARFLEDCLESALPLTDQIIVIDSGSDDATLDIARRFGCQVEHAPFTGFASQRNHAMQLARTPWVLFLDADERLRPPLTAEISTSVASSTDEIAGFWIPRRNRCFGRWLQGGGWWPDLQARLLRVDRAHYKPSQEVHETVVFDGTTGSLKQAMIHLNYDTRMEFITKQHAYTRLKAERSTKIPSRRAYVSMPVREMFLRMIKLHGYRDGTTGLFLSAVLAYEEACFVYLRRKQHSADELP